MECSTKYAATIPQTEKERRQLDQWEKAKEQAPVFYVIKTIIILLCAYEFGWLTWGYFYKRGWSHTPARFSIEDIVIDIVSGLVVGLWEWSEMQRKFEHHSPNKDSTMI